MTTTRRIDDDVRPQTRNLRVWTSFGNSVLMALLLGSAGCRSGSEAISDPPAPDDASAAQSFDPTTGEDPRLSGIGLLTKNPFHSARVDLPDSVEFSPACGGSSEHAAICAVWSKVDATWNARDAERFSRLFADDVSFTFVQRGQSLDGRTTILDHFRERFARFAPDLRHRTRISAVHAIAPGVFTADGKVEILRHAAGGAEPTVLRTFAIFAVMSGNDEDWSIRTLRVYELSAAADDAG